MLLTIGMAACGREPSQPPPTAASSGSRQQIVVPAPVTPHLELGASQIVLRDIASDTDDPYHEPDGEPSIAINPVDPKEIAILAFSGNWGADVGIAAPIWKSFDGGMTWKKLPLIPAPKKLTLGPPINRTVSLDGPSDQSLTYDSTGRLIVAEMGSDRDDRRFNMTVLYRQTGGPREPLVQMPAAFGDGIVDQPIVSSGAGTCVARTYAAWLNTAKQMSMHSLAWSDAVSSLGVAESSELPTRTTRLAVDRSNAAYLLYKTRVPSDSMVESVSFRVRRSDDCGSSWNALGGPLGVRVHATPTVRSLYTSDFAALQPLGLSIQPRAKSSDAWIAVHGETGDVYVAHLDVTASGVSRIVMARSTDKGRTWSSRDVTDGTAMSAYPEIAVNAEGVVGILFIDFIGTGRNLTFRHRVALSADKGKSWNISTLQTLTARQLTEDILTLETLARERLAEYNGTPELWGDFEALTTWGTTFYGVFTGASIGRRLSELDPILFTVDAHAVAETPPELSTPPAPPVTPVPSVPSSGASPAPASRTYTVGKGDSLWRIAKRTSGKGKGKDWPALYKRNSTIIKRPDLIYPHMTLQLPW